MSTNLPQPDRILSPAAVDALLLDTTPWLSCEDCFERMDAYVEGLVDGPSHHDPTMSAHLRGCPACAEEAESLLDLIRDHAPQ
ncbi:MAG: anti-sigma factor family protein [Ornithinibacter sp.]